MDEGRIQRVITLTEQLGTRDDHETRRRWEEQVSAMPSPELIKAASRLTSDAQHRPARIKALREGILAEIERKNAERIIYTLTQLDRAASHLTWASVFLAVVGTLLAAVQVWQGFR
jgi:hypothetical protein